MESNELKQSLIRLPEVIKRTGLSRSTIYSYINQDIFPKTNSAKYSDTSSVG